MIALSIFINRTELRKGKPEWGPFTEVATAEAAVSLCRREEFDLILMDGLFAPNAMTGIQAMKLIREIPTSGPTPIIINVTGMEGVGDYDEKALAAGANAVVGKPFNNRLWPALETTGAVARGRGTGLETRHEP